MKIHITEKAAKWYEEELELQPPAYIRFFPRYGGVGGQIPGFSLGINNNSPTDMRSSVKVNDITFFIEAKDAWYFDDKNLAIRLNEQKNEPEFSYE